MQTVSDILNYLWEIAPRECAESWDNVGHLVGRRTAPVTRIVVALDITMDVIREAKSVGAELIVSHHPLIWDSYRHVTDSVFQQEKVMTLLENGIAAICMHTNLDEAEDGVDDTLIEVLGLKAEGHLAEGKVGHICTLPTEMPLQEFLRLVKDRLGANGLRYCDGGKGVRRVATGCGSCGDYLTEAVEAGCDTFVTGDVKHNLWIDAVGQGINLIDAGHYSTENPIVGKLVRKLSEAFPEILVTQTLCMDQPEQFFV